jgi:glycine oxidase
VSSQVHVVGGGVIGLSCAWELARRGRDVTVLGPPDGREAAAWVAAGMLAPVTETHFGEDDHTRLLLEGAAQWPRFAEELQAATGRDIGYDTSGTVAVALDASDRAGLDDLWEYQQALGLESQRRSASECRKLVPALSPAVRGGTEVPGDHQVDNRALLGALEAACRMQGVAFDESRALGVSPGPGVLLEDGRRSSAELVVLAAGVGVAALSGLEGAGIPPLRPVKGHILRLGASGYPGSAGVPLLERTVRGLVHGRSVYLVPRRDGSLVVGATVEERGRDTVVQAGAVHQLLDDARAIVPGVDEMELREAAAGLRPATPDNRPCIGWTAIEGVLVATGHFRNGILLAPLTARAVADLCDRAAVAPSVEALAPR